MASPALDASTESVTFGSMKISRILPLLSVLMASCGVEGLSPDRKAVGGCQMSPNGVRAMTPQPSGLTRKRNEYEGGGRITPVKPKRICSEDWILFYVAEQDVGS